jgi:hypothetical protein
MGEMQTSSQSANTFDHSNKNIDFRLWALWVASTTLSSTVGWVAVNLITFAEEASSGYPPTPGDDTPRFVMACFTIPVLVVFWSITIGLAQGLVLRYTIRFREWKSWWLATDLGMILTTLMLYCSFFNPGALSIDVGWFLVVLPGPMLGLTQWFVLVGNLRIQKSGWWVATTTVAFILGLVVDLIVHNLLYMPNETELDLPYYPVQALVAWSISWAIGALVFGATTGAALVWLLRRSQAYSPA